MRAAKKLAELREAATPGPLENTGTFDTRPLQGMQLIVTNYPPAIAACGVGYIFGEEDAALIVALVNAHSATDCADRGGRLAAQMSRRHSGPPPR